MEDDFVLYESTAILTYLEAIHPSPLLTPADPRGRALVDMHMKLYDLELTRQTGTIIFPSAFARATLESGGNGAIQRRRSSSEILESSWRVGNIWSRRWPSLAEVWLYALRPVPSAHGHPAASRSRRRAERILNRPTPFGPAPVIDA